MSEASRHIHVMPYAPEEYDNKSPVIVTKPADPELVKKWHESREYFQEQRRLKSVNKAFKVKRK